MNPAKDEVGKVFGSLRVTNAFKVKMDWRCFSATANAG